MNILKGLKPEKVFYYFEEISSIPRGSGHTDKIREYCEKFASDRNLRYISDDSNNIIIFKTCICQIVFHMFDRNSFTK